MTPPHQYHTTPYPKKEDDGIDINQIKNPTTEEDKMDYDDLEDENEEIEMCDDDDDDDYEEIFLQHELNKSGLLLLVTLGTTLCTQYYMKYLMKRKVRASICSGWQYVIEVLNTPGESYRMFRIEPYVFIRLAKLLMKSYGLRSTRTMRAEEALAMFLWTCAHGHSNRNVQSRFQHSGETISRTFAEILKSLIAFSRDIIQPPDCQFKEISSKIREDYRFWPHFKGAIGAMDDTHIRAVITPKDNEIPYIGRKGYATQNVMAICNFDMLFTFVQASWEGSAHDTRILTTLEKYKNSNLFPNPPQGKYYLADVGYPNMKGYLAPFKGSQHRYHLPDFRRSSKPPTGHYEVFNFTHASLRNVIERTFGAWKNRWRILLDMPSYEFSTQCRILVTTMTLHNYIRKYAIEDEEFNRCDQDPNYMPLVEDDEGEQHTNQYDNSIEHGGVLDDNDMFSLRNKIVSSLISR